MQHLDSTRQLFNGMLQKTNLILLLETGICSTGLVLFILCIGAEKAPTMQRFELAILLLLAILGMLFMVAAGDFLSFYLGLEMQSLSLYVLIAMNRDDSKCSEAAIKYFVLGALASGMILYGISMLYGYAGTTNFVGIAGALLNDNRDPLATVGMICVLCGLFFKVSAAPFHMWTPDVYEGAPLYITSVLATLAKLAAVGITLRILNEVFAPYIFSWQQILYLVSALTMLWGALGACQQTNLKRLLAYSSIGHIGFTLFALYAGTNEAMVAALLYTFIYVVMTLGVFACLLHMQKQGWKIDVLRDLQGLARARPMEAFVLAVLLLSMAGIPPLAGFFIKLEAFKAVLHTGLWSLPLIALVATVISTFYYLRVIKIMVCDDAEANTKKTGNSGHGLFWISALAAAINMGYILLPDVVIEWVIRACI